MMISFHAEQFWSKEPGEMRKCTGGGDLVAGSMHVLNMQLVVEKSISGSSFIETAKLCTACYEAFKTD